MDNKQTQIDVPVTDQLKVVIFSPNITDAEKLLFVSDLIKHINRFTNKVDGITDAISGPADSSTGTQSTRQHRSGAYIRVRKRSGRNGGRKPSTSADQWSAYVLESRKTTDTKQLMSIAHQYGFNGATASGFDKWVQNNRKRYGVLQ
jgi:hypothetical protein